MTDTKKKPDLKYVWRGRRYWTMEPGPNEHIGWNTRFEPYLVIRITAKKIIATFSVLDDVVHLDRERMERHGKVYHSRFGEYFYAEKPAHDPEAVRFLGSPTQTKALSLLGLTAPASAAQIKVAYKRLARQRHPDCGGSHAAFIELSEAYEAAMNVAR